MKNMLLIVFLALAALSFTELAVISAQSEIIIVRMIDFESPANLRDFFNFQYYLRDVSGIEDKAVVDFWIEKDGKEIAFGSDNFFLDASNRTVKSKIFLPSDLESGVYTFNIRASHGEFSSESYRTIEIAVKNGVVDIGFNDWSNLILISLILLAILNLGLIYYIEKDKISRIFNFREAFTTGEVFFERHRFTILTFSSFLIFGALIYYLDYAEKLPKTFANIGYFILGILAVLMLARIIYDKFFSTQKSAERTSEKNQKQNPKRLGGRFKRMNDWLQEDVKFNSKNDDSEKKTLRKMPSKIFTDAKKDKI